MFEAFHIAKAKVKVIKEDSKIARFIARKIDIIVDLVTNQLYLKTILKKEFFNFKSDLSFFYIDSNLISSYYYYFYFYQMINLKIVLFYLKLRIKICLKLFK